MRFDPIVTVLFAFSAACGATAWVSALRFTRKTDPTERRRISGVVGGAILAAFFAFAAIWLMQRR